MAPTHQGMMSSNPMMPPVSRTFFHRDDAGSFHWLGSPYVAAIARKAGSHAKGHKNRKASAAPIQGKRLCPAARIVYVSVTPYARPPITSTTMRHSVKTAAMSSRGLMAAGV